MPRAVLLVSLGATKVQELRRGRDQTRLFERIRRLATALRTQPGVRSVECVTFKAWQNAAAPDEKPRWEPYGALVVVDASARGQLDKNIASVWNTAAKYDQEMLAAHVIDDWG